MKVYIAGKIAGDKQYRGKFLMAEDRLKGEGFTVLNPALLPEGLEQADYMRICFAMLDCADCAVFLADWKESKGAVLEMEWCKYTGKPAVIWHDDLYADDVAKLVREAVEHGKP